MMTLRVLFFLLPLGPSVLVITSVFAKLVIIVVNIIYVGIQRLKWVLAPRINSMTWIIVFGFSSLLTLTALYVL